MNNSRAAHKLLMRNVPLSLSMSLRWILNPLGERFSSIVEVVEGDKRMGDYVASIRGVR